MGFSGFEVHWNTAFHAMSFTNKTVRIMLGVTFSLQRNWEIRVSSWGADLSLEGTNWAGWWWNRTADGDSGTGNLLEQSWGEGVRACSQNQPFCFPWHKREAETMLSPSSSLFQSLGGKCGWLQGRNGITVKLSSYQGGICWTTRVALPLVSGGVGRRRMGLICSKGSLSSLDISSSGIWTRG